MRLLKKKLKIEREDNYIKLTLGDELVWISSHEMITYFMDNPKELANLLDKSEDNKFNDYLSHVKHNRDFIESLNKL